MVHKIFKYLNVWNLLAQASFCSFFISKVSAFLFLFGKIIRFLFFLLFLILLFTQTKAFQGYNFNEILLFYLTFNFIDAATQMLYREVYRFRQKIISGNFDFTLLKPVSPLFHTLYGWTDILDLITLVPMVVAIGFIINRVPGINFSSFMVYIGLIINALLIATSFHIFVLALAVLTTEIDHAIMIYRDVVAMGKLPVDIYREPLRFLITFVFPVGIMMTFPVQSLLGRLRLIHFVLSFFISGLFLIISIRFWDLALKKYTSASS